MVIEGHSINQFLAGELCAIGVPEISVVPTEVVSLGVVGNLDEAAGVRRDRACQKKTHRLGELEIAILRPWLGLMRARVGMLRQRAEREPRIQVESRLVATAARRTTPDPGHRIS